MIRNNKEIQGAIDEVVSNNDAIKRSQSPLRTKAYWIPIISSAVIGVGGIVAAVVTAIVAANR